MDSSILFNFIVNALQISVDLALFSAIIKINTIAKQMQSAVEFLRLIAMSTRATDGKVQKLVDAK